MNNLQLVGGVTRIPAVPGVRVATGRRGCGSRWGVSTVPMGAGHVGGASANLTQTGFLVAHGDRFGNVSAKE